MPATEHGPESPERCAPRANAVDSPARRPSTRSGLQLSARAEGPAAFAAPQPTSRGRPGRRPGRQPVLQAGERAAALGRTAPAAYRHAKQRGGGPWSAMPTRSFRGDRTRFRAGRCRPGRRTSRWPSTGEHHAGSVGGPRDGGGTRKQGRRQASRNPNSKRARRGPTLGIAVDDGGRPATPSPRPTARDHQENRQGRRCACPAVDVEHGITSEGAT